MQSLTGEEAGNIRREKCVKVIKRKIWDTEVDIIWYGDGTECQGNLNIGLELVLRARLMVFYK